MSKDSKKKKDFSLNDALKYSHKNLSNWQCFQKHIIPSLQGPRQQRNIEAGKMWKSKSLNQKKEYDCSSNNKKFSHKDISSESIKSNNSNDKLNIMVENILKEIDEARNYKLEIPDLNYTTTTINTEMLKNIIFKYDQIKSQLSQLSTDRVNLLKKQILETNSWLENQEEKNQASFNDLQNELKNINQTSDTIESLEQKLIGNTSPSLKTSSLLELAKNNNIILRDIKDLLNKTQNFNNFKVAKLKRLIDKCQNIIVKIYDNYENTIGKTKMFVELEIRKQEMKKLEMSKNHHSLEDYNLCLTDIKII